MKILLANKFFFRNGGSETVMFGERERLLRHGHEVVDFAMADDRNEPTAWGEYFPSNIDYRVGGQTALSRARSAVSLIHNGEAVRKLRRLLFDTRPDIVHFHNIYHQLTPSLIGEAQRAGVPSVLTLHDYKPICPTYLRLREGRPCSLCTNGNFSHATRTRCAGGSLFRSALLTAEAYTHRALGSYTKVSAVICPSRFVAESHTPFPFRPDQVVHIPNGIELGHPGGDDYDGDYALYLGRLVPEKGVDVLMQVDWERTGLRLVVAGAGPELERLRRAHPQVEFVGQVSGERKWALLRGAAAVVIPSIWYENAPMTALEAMAVGRPLVVSDIGGLGELVTEGTGFVVPPGDPEAMGDALAALDAPDVRRRMGLAARARVEREFTLDLHMQRLTSLYERLIADPSS